MEYRKNDIVTLEIVDCGTDGEGIGKADGFTVFVKDAVIGDTVTAKIMKAKKNYGYGRLMEILKPSPYRVDPICPSARQCGGCQLQAVSYEEQKAFKEKKLRGHLERIGGFKELPMEPLIGMDEPYHYRNKAQFPVGRNKEGRIVTGFYAGRTHAIIENRDCALGIPQNKEVLDRVIAHMEKYNIAPYDEMTGKGLVRHIFVRYGLFTGELMVCLIINGQDLPHQKELVEKLGEIPGMTSISLNINKKRNNVILGDKVKTIWGKEYITDKIGDISYEISPLSFFQVNPHQTWKLYSKALEYADLHGEETVWDLYCGIGTISLFLAQKAKFVRGVEIVPAAIEDARRNAHLNEIDNVEFFVGKAEEVLPREYEKNGVYADVIVVDPPRKGCDEMLLKTILKMQPKRVVYVSCDSATLARDLRFLCDNGYELKTVKAAIEVNESQKLRLVRKAANLVESFDGMKVCVLGLTFKPETDDLREAPSIPNIQYLLERGAEVVAYDPVGIENAKNIFKDSIKYTTSIDEAIEDADICFIMTEWKQILNYDISNYKHKMKRPLVFDGRNCYTLDTMKDLGIEYYSIGR